MTDIIYRVYLGSVKVDEFTKPNHWPFIWSEGIRIQRIYRRRCRWFQVKKITHIHYRGVVRIQVKMVDGPWTIGEKK